MLPWARLDLARVAALIDELPARSVIALVGAGASVSAGIPDYDTAVPKARNAACVNGLCEWFV